MFTIAIMTVYGAMLGSANALLLSYLQSLHSKSPGNSCHLQIRRDLSCEGCHRPPSFRLLAVTTVESPDITWDAFTGQSSRITNDDISQKVEQFQPSSFKSLVSNGSILDQAQQLKDSVDIVSVIESYQLDGFRRMGNRATAVCPFHNDHIPSLSIDSSRRIYKCFACGAGGDVFRFVQEYSKLPGQVEKSFGEAVWQISKTFGDGSIGSSYTSKRSMEEQHELLRKKDRILLANAAAAAFYADCLKQPFAGGARYHLLSRRVSVSSILTFSMGYAPDTYYDGRRSWGDGSLVYRLRDLGFTPAEILNAGLAIRIKKSNQESKKSVLGSSEALATNDEHSAEDVDYSSLMDRFRGRLMVPILDTSGTKILAFGGRVISPPETGCVVTKLNDFKAPKYLNSPESDVFEKKKILFGQNLATNAIRDAIDSATSTPLLIVEGYMDAIALWDAGITSVVASMGTAVTLEQLEAAAKTAGTRGGRIVLCLDNDDAGVAAIERLCRNGMLSEAATKYIVAISVARLPDRVKDPAEFIEFRKAGGTDLTQVADDFRKEVIDVAVEWTEWFIQRVVAKYDVTAPRGAVGSFSNIFESVADFLATALRPADRTKRAYEVAGLLSNILAKERNSTEISSAVRIQLESDLIDLASRLSDAKEALQRRVESVSGLSTTHASSAVSALSRGYGPSSSDQDDKISKRARSRVTFDDSTKGSADNNSKSPLPGVPASRQTSARVQLKQTRAKIQRQRDVESLTPHFAGFRFSHQSDSDWLGLHVEKVSRIWMPSIIRSR